ncbi:unnamed protein product, partial [Mycena citricolor]
FAGHVVAVVERMTGQAFLWHARTAPASSAATKEKQEAERREREGDRGDEPRRAPIERPKIVWFKPTDSNSESYVDKLFVACIKRHPISSLHPFGTLVEELGPIGDIEVETSLPLPLDTAKDLDDAVSVKLNEDGTYDVGVHIADVSFFVKPNTALDRDARKRATSVTFLVPGKERLAFSAVFTMTGEGVVLKKWFGKTVIKSAAQLAYRDAQNVIEGKSLGSVAVAAEHAAVDIEHDIKILEVYAHDNIAVAQQIAVHLPEQALLRRHDNPIERRLVAFTERAQRLGYQMDTSSAGALMKSFDAVADPTARRLLQLLSFKATQRAKYFCAGMLDIAKYSHYALNTPLYTHFTSPIRRYADLMVHRQLESVLQGAASAEPKFTMDRDAVAKVAQQCNMQQTRFSDARPGTICALVPLCPDRRSDSALRACCPTGQGCGCPRCGVRCVGSEFGIEKRVHVDQMPIDNHVYDDHTHTLQIYWSTRDVITWLAENSDDEHLKKVKENAEQHAVKMEVASRSVHDESALFDEDEGDDDEIVLGRAEVAPSPPETSAQRLLSIAKVQPQFEGLRTTAAGHKIRTSASS